MKLTLEFLLYQLLTQCLPGFNHKRKALGPPLLDARLHPMGANRDNHQRHSWHASTWRAEPPEGIQEADPLHGGVLEGRRLPHDQTHEVVDDGENHQLLQHAWHGFAMQHIHLHRRLKMRQRCFYLPASAVQLGKVGDRVDLCIEQRRHQGDLTGAEPRRAEVVTHLPEH
jgi:hypothetical protein